MIFKANRHPWAFIFHYNMIQPSTYSQRRSKAVILPLNHPNARWKFKFKNFGVCLCDRVLLQPKGKKLLLNHWNRLTVHGGRLAPSHLSLFTKWESDFEEWELTFANIFEKVSFSLCPGPFLAFSSPDSPFVKTGLFMTLGVIEKKNYASPFLSSRFTFREVWEPPSNNQKWTTVSLW